MQPFLSTITSEDITTSAAIAVKILFLIGFVVYVVFAFILLRQTKIMRSTVETPLGSKLRIIAILHFLLSLVLIVVSLVIL